MPFANVLPSEILYKLRIIRLTVPVFFLSMVIASMMILDSVCERILGVRDVVYMMMAVLIVDNHFVSGAYDRSMKVRETVSVPCQSSLDCCKGQCSQ